MALSRRKLLTRGLALAAAGLWVPRRLAAAPVPSAERKFLFVFARGGWDTTCVFTPLFGNPYADVEADATTAEANGITYVDRATRPSVRGFFERWGDQTCVLNGVEVRSVTHERCRRIVLTGSSDAASDDWPTNIAARSALSLACPYLVLGGPAYTAKFTSEVVRVGSDGQLSDLLSGEALERSTLPVVRMDGSLEALGDTFVRERAAQAAASASSGGAARYAARYATALEQLDQLRDAGAGLDLGGGPTGCSVDVVGNASKIFDCFELGLSRCGIVESLGWCDSGWDTHADNTLQDVNFEDLFRYLDTILLDLEGRTSVSGAPLAEEVTIVVISEMGREPTANTWGGKNHWTYTSAMLIGAGVRGGQVIGQLDDNAHGVPVDLATGDTAEAGTALTAGHLGATLYALAGLDPLEINPQYEAIAGALV
ncbi:MAG: DUF1501 domain-containing protein [Pseudomonadota bacterium]|nr:DUF1501 domain-containing protein [Pseudomonadota bacterium]